MHSLFLLPPTLLTFLLASPILFGPTSSYAASAEPTSHNDQFREIAIRRTPADANAPVCCLKPLEPLDSVEEDILLSFEEWKARQLQDVNASGRATSRSSPGHGADTEYNDSLAILPPGAGSGSEGAEGPTADDQQQQQQQQQQQYLLSPHFRIPLTDRFNYASLDCSARVHGAHRSAKSPHALLDAKKDKYMLSPCTSRAPAGERQYVVVELCDDIRIDTVQLANFELFSGVFKEFSVSVAKTFVAGDGEGWVPVGTYRARNVRGLQSFHPPTSLSAFYRFIRIDIHSHYGNEFYCPISLLRVYGLTHLEEFKWDVWVEEAEERAGMQRAAAADAQARLAVEAAPSPALEDAEAEAEAPRTATASDEQATMTGSANTDGTVQGQEAISAEALPDATSSDKTDLLTSFMDALESGLPSLSDIRADLHATTPYIPVEDFSTTISLSTSDAYVSSPAVTASAEGGASVVYARSEEVAGAASAVASTAESLASAMEQVTADGMPGSAAVPTPGSAAGDQGHTTAATADSSAVESASSGSVTSGSTATGSSVSTSQESQTTHSVSSTPSPSSSSSTTSMPHPPPPVFGGGGESIYRTIMNRLTALEANHSLYARYVEEQTTGVREVLRRMGEEMGRLEGLGKMQAQMYQRSVHEWERQRLRLEMDHGELLERVNYLADEIVLEKRLGLAQLCLLLAVLVFMGLTRGSRTMDAADYRRILRHQANTPSRSSSVREWGRRKLSLSGLSHTFGAPGEWIKLRSRTPSRTPSREDGMKQRRGVGFDLSEDKLQFPSQPSVNGNISDGVETGSSTVDQGHPPALDRPPITTNPAAHHSSPTLGRSSSSDVNTTPAYIHLAAESHTTHRPALVASMAVPASAVASSSKRSSSGLRTPLRSHAHHAHAHGSHNAHHRAADVWSPGLARPRLVRTSSSASGSGAAHPLHASTSLGSGLVNIDRFATGSAFVPRSAKKWARTAHLHEVKRTMRPGNAGHREREREREREVESAGKGKERDKESDAEDVFGPTIASHERNGSAINLASLAKEKEKRVRVVSAGTSEGDAGADTDAWIDTDTETDLGDVNGKVEDEVEEPGTS
ncbi:hypothetical protein CONPUDRAFT_165623 [Coniophora puteana RWD-64-598 SS2]|uniref:SUN domain-containing protein n=1 Tax=Coniophora puteana (strain RWD-64-598) TaxID=741705 RepID=A0A5M3MQP1_CONPW|nr:uncharacterized protein CONPUDRAFT_165623 [Coniophora puteana RWD-64-598 SS2]EIW81499.1 hypothetical protein CONPUDRAFT_165623 [Coniophora puteana RWD-64-598 SS2]